MRELVIGMAKIVAWVALMCVALWLLYGPTKEKER